MADLLEKEHSKQGRLGCCVSKLSEHSTYMTSHDMIASDIGHITTLVNFTQTGTKTETDTIKNGIFLQA